VIATSLLASRPSPLNQMLFLEHLTSLVRNVRASFEETRPIAFLLDVRLVLPAQFETSDKGDARARAREREREREREKTSMFGPVCLPTSIPTGAPTRAHHAWKVSAAVA